MAKKAAAANRLDRLDRLDNIDLAYEGYDPNWIIGTHGDPLPHWSYGPYAAAAASNYGIRVNQSQSHTEDSHRGFFSYHDPYRATSVPTAARGPAGPQTIAPGQSSGPVVKASKVVPAPTVTKVVYPHGQGHNLGTGQGHKNTVMLSIPDCCEGCEDKWKDKLIAIPGCKGVNVDRGPSKMTLKATVFGDMDTHSVMKAIQKVQPRAELWGGPGKR